jgi:hypothetical protein
MHEDYLVIKCKIRSFRQQLPARMAPFRLVPDDLVQVSKELLYYQARVAAREGQSAASAFPYFSP